MSLSHSGLRGERSLDHHPCFSEEAVHHYARMHLAVAPACNIQCHYCHRKYDCANESRPGVVSGLVTPEEALVRVSMAKARLPNLTVIGIAGPGDALANPARTFETCRRILAEFPDLMLCLSTNGLALPEHVDTIATLGIHHVTVTINAIDPEVGRHIYPWIYWKNRRIRSSEAAKILIDRQQEGIARLVTKKIWVKINSVLIPGVNDDHLPKVHTAIAGHGVFTHNIMPLISVPEHGTYYGLMGQREPTAHELTRVRSRCGLVKMMTHCRQCRSDAIGLLNDEILENDAGMSSCRSEQVNSSGGRVIPLIPVTGHVPPGISRPDRMVPRRIAIASHDGVHVNAHFGQASILTIFECFPDGGIRQSAQWPVPRYCFGDADCGTEQAPLETIVTMLSGCEAILCERIGYGPWQRLEAAGIQPINTYAGWRILQAIADHIGKHGTSTPMGGLNHGILEPRLAVASGR
ncbi:MAG: nitrogenase cofactor biosynthesis protein NifB [Magnetococcales bacterium]|nr:nitrogenase cofactor biosynthesis protein NifB [Magnetococcales bacterium]